MVATKPSGIAWIGEIPANWETNKLKYMFKVVNGSTPDTSNNDFWDGEIAWITPADMEEFGDIGGGDRSITEKGYRACGTSILPKGSIVISTRAPIGKINYTTAPLCTNQGCKSLVYAGGVSRYFYYLLMCGQEELIMRGRGTTFIELGTSDLGNMEASIPTLPEQQAIAAFLDGRCGQIDDIVADLEHQVEILRQYKKALITETVTKGLDKSAPMKGSGIDWIGQMPRHWEMQRVKYVTSIISKGATPEDIFNEQTERYPIRFLKAENIKNSLIDSDPEFYIDRTADNGLRRSRLQANDLLFVIAGATIGKVAQMNPDLLPANINQAISFLRPNGYVLPRYLLYVLDSYIVAEVIQLLMVQAAQPNISMANLGNIEFPLAPRGEQAAIVEFLDRKCAETDDLVAEKQKAAETMRQYKKSLIYEYVTGKKRVAG